MLSQALMSAGKQTYRIKEFAALTGVSVRALHYYDRLGLLKARRAASGYRIYGADDVAVLEQIVALKFIGISLRDTKRLLRTERRDLTGVLVAQRVVLEEKRRRLDLAIAAVREAQEVGGQPLDTGRINRIIEVIKMQDQRHEWKKQYDALLQGKIDKLKAMSPEAREQLRGQFAELCKEIQGVLEEDPAGPRAQELAGRWLQLLGAFAPKGEVNPHLGIGDGLLHRCRQRHWPSSVRRLSGPIAAGFPDDFFGAGARNVTYGISGAITVETAGWNQNWIRRASLSG